MRLPVYHKVSLLDFSFENIKDALVKNSIGKAPVIIEVPGKNQEFAEQILETLYAVLEDLNVHPRIPYPIYVLTKEVITFKDLMIVNHSKSLSNYFNKKIKMLKVREQALLNKTNLRTSRILNHPVRKDLELFHSQRKESRYLNHLSFERNAYLKISKMLDDH